MDSKQELAERLRNWLKSDAVLSKTRQFLGGQGLGENKIANWKRKDREMPDAFLEGAALYHCAVNESLDLRAADRTGLIGECFWQAFVVQDEPNAITGHHDCQVVRLWEGVRKYRETKKETFLTHKTWFTGTPSEVNPVSNIVSGQPITDQSNSKSDDDGWRTVSQSDDASAGREIALIWSVNGSEPRDLGYSVDLEGTVASLAIGHQRHEYLGGLSIIPVRSSIIVAAIPNRLLKKSDALFSDFGFIAPQCLEFLADGAPIGVLESFLQGRLSKKHLAPWFEVKGPMRLWRDFDFTLPKSIERALSLRGDVLESESHTVFATQVLAPAPYLYNSLVFELPGGGDNA